MSSYHHYINRNAVGWMSVSSPAKSAWHVILKRGIDADALCVGYHVEVLLSVPTYL